MRATTARIDIKVAGMARSYGGVAARADHTPPCAGFCLCPT